MMIVMLGKVMDDAKWCGENTAGVEKIKNVIARSGKAGALGRRGNLVAMHKHFAGSLCIRRDCHAALAMTWFLFIFQATFIFQTVTCYWSKLRYR
jgi:hypothetical protein